MAITTISFIFIIVMVMSLVFTLTNGLHDASSVVATLIACGAASPGQAILLAASCGFVGAVTSGSAVANTVSAIVDVPADNALLKVLLAAVTGAVLWNIVTWKFGFPSSSTHALVGGLIGAVWAARGAGSVLWGWQELIAPGHQLSGIMKVLAGLLFSPLLGFIAAFILQRLANLLFRNAKYTLNTWLKRVQWLIAALLAYSHGANDTQKTVGIIVLALASAGLAGGQVSITLIKALAGALMFAGTLLGGWPIMRTIGRGIYTIRPLHSLNSQIASGGSLILATLLGAPVSTTHVVVGSVVGVGTADEFRMVNWHIGREILIAWCVTIPASTLAAAGIFLLLQAV